MDAIHFEEYLARHGALVYHTEGSSMRPLLRANRDLVVIEPAAGRLKRYDVALYRGTDRRYILHRIIRVRENDYVIRGDNCLTTEYGTTDRDILGIMTAFVRDGRAISVASRGYRCYARLWCALFPLRLPLLYGRRLLAGCWRRARRYATGRTRGQERNL